jgi:hypothetical protein
LPVATSSGGCGRLFFRVFPVTNNAFSYDADVNQKGEIRSSAAGATNSINRVHGGPYNFLGGSMRRDRSFFGDVLH